MRVYVAPPTTAIEEFCLPLLARDHTGGVRRAIDDFYTCFRTTDLCSFVTHVLNDRLIQRREAAWADVPGMCAAIGMPLRHIRTEDDEYYDFYSDHFFSPHAGDDEVEYADLCARLLPEDFRALVF